MLHQGVSEENGIEEEVTGSDGTGHGSNHHRRNSGHGRNFESPHSPALSCLLLLPECNTVWWYLNLNDTEIKGKVLKILLTFATCRLDLWEYASQINNLKLSLGIDGIIQILEYTIPPLRPSVRARNKKSGWRYLGNEKSYQRSAGVETTRKIQNI